VCFPILKLPPKLQGGEQINKNNYLKWCPNNTKLKTKYGIILGFNPYKHVL